MLSAPFLCLVTNPQYRFERGHGLAFLAVGQTDMPTQREFLKWLEHQIRRDCTVVGHGNEGASESGIDQPYGVFDGLYAGANIRKNALL